MRAFVGLDLSLNSVTICVVDGEGDVIWEGKAEGHPEAVLKAIEPWREYVGRIGRRARGRPPSGSAAAWRRRVCPSSAWRAGTAKAALSAMVAKTDRGDARGIAQIARAGRFTGVHMKSPQSWRRRTPAAAREFLVRSMTATEQAIRGLLRPFGLEVGAVTRRRFADRVHELVGENPVLGAIVDAWLECAWAPPRRDRAAAPIGPSDRACRSRLPTADDDAGDRTGERADVPGDDRRSEPLQAVSIRGRLPRAHAAAASVRRARHDGSDHQDRRRGDAHRAARGRERHPAPLDAVVCPEGMGDAGGRSSRNAPSEGGSGLQNGGRPPPHVDERSRSPLDEHPGVAAGLVRGSGASDAGRGPVEFA